MSLNVRGINEPKKRRNLFRWLHRNEWDISFVQETYSSTNVEQLWKNEWGGNILFSHGSIHSRGTIILFRNHANVEIINHKEDYKGRFILLKIKINESLFTLLNIYAPNKEKEQMNFYDDLDKVMSAEENSDCNWILGGDWNVTIDPDMDKKGGIIDGTHRKKVREKVLTIMQKHGLADVWRSRNPDKVRFTYRQKTPLIQSRLDYWALSDILVDCVEDSSILSSPSPDHSAVTLHLKKLPDTRRGPGIWKFNNSLLKDEAYTKN